MPSPSLTGGLSISERYGNDGSTRLLDCSFDSNHALGAAPTGGALASTKAEGGAVHFASAGAVEIDGCTFTSNAAASGGALAAVAATTVQLRSNSLRYNRASESGGGLMATLAVVTSADDAFDSNEALAGGAIFFLSAQVWNRDTHAWHAGPHTMCVCRQVASSLSLLAQAQFARVNCTHNSATSSGGAIETSNSELSVASGVEHSIH